MIPAVPPENETERLAALRRYQVLDSESEQAFDEIVELASQICQTPIALVSLIDEKRQWFKASVGLDATETPRELAFCAHAIHGEQLFEIPETLEDERFADNPFVTGDPHVRFYAGMPLITEDGQALGTLCVIDRQPRTLNELQTRTLQVLSKQVMTQLELRLKLKEAAAEAERSASMRVELERKNGELREQVDIITEQQELISELEIPVIEIWDGVLCAPLVGVLDHRRATMLTEHMLAEISARAAAYAILDLTGIESLDIATAEHLRLLLQAIKLLGAQALITGIRPQVATAITARRIDFMPHLVFRSLRDALQFASRS